MRFGKQLRYLSIFLQATAVVCVSIAGYKTYKAFDELNRMFNNVTGVLDDWYRDMNVTSQIDSASYSRQIRESMDSLIEEIDTRASLDSVASSP